MNSNVTWGHDHATSAYLLDTPMGHAVVKLVSFKTKVVSDFSCLFEVEQKTGRRHQKTERLPQGNAKLLSILGPPAPQSAILVEHSPSSVNRLVQSLRYNKHIASP